MTFPQRYTTESYTVEVDGKSYVIPGVELWLVQDDDVWYVWCMDCGIKLGSVDAGDEADAYRCSRNHRNRMHKGER